MFYIEKQKKFNAGVESFGYKKIPINCKYFKV